MGIFINLEIDLERCVGISRCGKCLKICPVRIFGAGDGYPVSLTENEDECTLCNLCLDVCEPNAIKVCRLYE
jgi:NAD-dependent dihydropyrimidine dehydrogenase PreA subunit